MRSWGSSGKARLISIDSSSINKGATSFRFVRQAADGAYFLEHERDEGGTSWLNTFREFRMFAMEAPYSPPECISPSHADYVSLVNSPDFKIPRVVQESEAGKTLSKVFFQYRTTSSKEPTIEGWLRLDPSMKWAIQDYEYERQHTVTNADGKTQTRMVIQFKGAVHYREVDGVAVPREVEFTRVANGRSGVRHVLTLSEYAITETPPREFTLAAFGLGDLERTLVEVKRRNSSRNVGLTAVAVVACFISFLLYRKGRAIQKGRTERRGDSFT